MSSESDEIHISGGGHEFLILKDGDLWESQGICGVAWGIFQGRRFPTKEAAINETNLLLAVLVCKQKHISPRLARAFMKVKNAPSEKSV